MKRQTLAYIAYALICVIWGTTYLAIKVAVIHYPPFLMAGIRQVSAGLIIGVLAIIINRDIDLSVKNLLIQGFVGFLLITMGNGLVTWAAQFVPSGVASLICSTMPIWAVLINILSGKEQLHLRVAFGMLIGFGGVALIFYDSLSQLTGLDPQLFIFGIIALFVATISWAWGSIFNKKNATAKNSFFNAGIQVFIGGSIMLFFSFVFEDYKAISIKADEGLFAFIYLVLFGSVLAFVAYIYALKVLPVGFVTSYAYFNPLVAVIIGNLILHESVNQNTILAFVFIILGIFIVRSGYRKQKASVN